MEESSTNNVFVGQGCNGAAPGQNAFYRYVVRSSAAGLTKSGKPSITRPQINMHPAGKMIPPTDPVISTEKKVFSNVLFNENLTEI